MPDTWRPKCAVCGAPTKWCCAFCGSNCYCDEHACNHIARQYPEEFGIKPRPEQREQQEREKTAKGYWQFESDENWLRQDDDDLTEDGSETVSTDSGH